MRARRNARLRLTRARRRGVTRRRIPLCRRCGRAARVADLLGQDLVGLQYDEFNPQLKSRVEQLGLDFDLVTPFTAFVAVDAERRAQPARKNRRSSVG